MKAIWLCHFEWQTRAYEDYLYVPTNISQTIHWAEGRMKEILSMSSKELQNEYPSIVNMLIEKEKRRVNAILDDEDDMTDLCGFNMQD